jgi:hypothetical protein
MLKILSTVSTASLNSIEQIPYMSSFSITKVQQVKKQSCIFLHKEYKTTNSHLIPSVNKIESDDIEVLWISKSVQRASDQFLTLKMNT